MIFISGPITADTHEGMMANVAHAREAHIRLLNAGALAVCPHTMTENYWNLCGASYETYMQVCLCMIDACDQIYMLKGWQDSKGARREHDYAVGNGLAVTYEIAEEAP